MKRKNRMESGIGRLTTAAASALMAGAWMAGDGALAAESPASIAAAEPPGQFSNWLELSRGGSLIDGDKAQFRRRQGIPRGAFGGVEDFHWEQEIGKKGLFKIDGRGIFDNHDYLLKLDLENPDIGYLRAGYREFLTWCDGSGGFFPQNGAWFSLFDEVMWIDRGEAWFEAGLTLPDKPQIRFRYSHQFRDGRKDSLIWGDSNLTGGFGTRGIVPSFLDIQEERNIFEADVKHALGKNDLGLGLRYEWSDSDNSRKIRRRPGESADRFVTQREGVDLDLFNVHAFTQTRLHEKALLTTGYSFTTLDTDLSGSRIYGAGYEAVYDPSFARRQFRDEGLLNLEGGSQLNQYVFNLNLMLSPFEHLTIVPSFRIERQDTEGSSRFLETDIGAPPRLAPIQEELAALSERAQLDITENLELRYTGLTNWVFYARGQWLQGHGDQNERDIVVETGELDLFRDTDFSRFTQKYTLGLNWYPRRRLNFAGQFYHKIHQSNFDHLRDSTLNTSGNRFPGFIRANEFETDDVNFRVTWRPFPNLTTVGRYDFQLSTIDNQSSGLSSRQAAETSSHIFGESITWSPLDRLYLQGAINYVFDQTETPAGQRTGAAQDLVLDSKNDYWNASASVGLALDNKTDLQALYYYYRADNYEDNSRVSLPYGAGAEEHGVTVALIRRFNPNLRWTIKYGYFSNRDQTSGGHNDYQAHVIFTSWQYQF